MYSHDSAIAELLQCFFVECEKRFRFLEEDHGYNYISGVVEYRNNYKIIRPYNGQMLNWDFTVVTRYEKGDQAVEVLFGDRNFLLEGYVYYDPIQRYEFSEVLAAAKKPDPSVHAEWGATDSRIISSALECFSGAVKKHSPYFTSAEEQFHKRVDAVRHKRIEQSVRSYFETQMQDTSTHAAKAFLNKDYDRVITLLQPYETYLAASDLKKLKLARKNIES